MLFANLHILRVEAEFRVDLLELILDRHSLDPVKLLSFILGRSLPLREILGDLPSEASGLVRHGMLRIWIPWLLAFDDVLWLGRSLQLDATRHESRTDFTLLLRA